MLSTFPISQANIVTALVVLLAQISGCADLRLPPAPTPVTPVPESLADFGKVGYGYFKSNGKTVRLVSLSVDGIDPIPLIYLDAGTHAIVVKLEWSNRWEDDTVLLIDVEPRHRYAILAFELAPGQQPEKAEIKLMDAVPDPAPWQYAAAGAASGALTGALPLIIMAAPLWLPAYWLSEKYPPPPPTGRPFENCCFVWIQDVDTGMVLGGQKPHANAKVVH